jgi:hypothetical protein
MHEGEARTAVVAPALSIGFCRQGNRGG